MVVINRELLIRNKISLFFIQLQFCIYHMKYFYSQQDLTLLMWPIFLEIAFFTGENLLSGFDLKNGDRISSKLVIE